MFTRCRPCQAMLMSRTTNCCRCVVRPGGLAAREGTVLPYSRHSYVIDGIIIPVSLAVPSAANERPGRANWSPSTGRSGPWAATNRDRWVVSGRVCGLLRRSDNKHNNTSVVPRDQATRSSRLTTSGKWHTCVPSLDAWQLAATG